MNRRDFIKSLLGSLAMLPFVGKFTQQKPDIAIEAGDLVYFDFDSPAYPTGNVVSVKKYRVEDVDLRQFAYSHAAGTDAGIPLEDFDAAWDAMVTFKEQNNG